MNKFISTFLFIFFISFSFSQSFQDSPSNGSDGDFPSKWDLIKGSSEISTLNGEKVMLLSNKGIITPLLNSKNYLQDEFTLEFEAYFDKMDQPIYYYQYYTIRFWDGAGNSVRQPSNGDIILYQPLQIQRNGLRFIGHKPNSELTTHQIFDKNLEGIEAAWRFIAIHYNKGALKVFIDGTQMLNIPRLNFNPKIISIGARSGESIRAIKNINISGIKTGTNTNNTVDNNNNTTGTGNTTNTEVQNYAYNLPEQDGETNQILQTNGNGNVSWIDIPVNNTTPNTASNEIILPKSYGAPNQILQTDGNGTINWIDFPLIEPEPHTHETSSVDNTTTNEENPNEETTNTNTGLEAIDEGNGIGWRLKGRDPNKYGNIGWNAVDLSISRESSSSMGATGKNSTAIGRLTTASGDTSIAMGKDTEASGRYSTAIGYDADASGEFSTAMGSGKASGEFSTAIGTNAGASGDYAIAMGYLAEASGEVSTAMGRSTIAKSAYSLTIGRNNIGFGNPTEWRQIDPLFEIGNGIHSNSRSNALTILKNGNMGITTHTPQAKLHIIGGTDASLNTGGYIIIGDKQGENLVFDNNEIMARNNVQPATLYLQHNGGDVFVGGKVVHSSDKRLKQDITNLSYGLKEIMQLRPVNYYWKANPEASNKSIGLIAQEVQPIIKELISTNTEHNNTLGVNYTELIPILIKAIQEQQDLIHGQNSEIKELKAEFKTIDQRIKLLEALQKTTQ